MMSLGFSNTGGSSSSSNLSPLAPPFTKTNSNQLVNFTELPNAIPFHSSLGSWQYSHSSAPRPDLFSNIDLGVDSIRTTCLPPADYYGYVVSHPASSPNTHVPPLSPNISTAAKTFTFSQHSSDMTRNHVEIEPYYSSSLSPVVADDNRLVAVNEPSYDSLSASSVVPLLGSAETDYTDSLSGLEYAPPEWGGICSLDDREQCKRVAVNGSFCYDGTSVTASNVYDDYIKQGTSPSEGLSKREEAQAVSHTRHVNGLGTESQILSPSAEMFNYKSSSLQDPSILSGESSKISISGSSRMQEFHGDVSSTESGTNFCNYQNPYSASYDKSFQQFDSCMSDCLPMKNSLPATENRLVSLGSTTNVPIAVSSEYVNSVGSFTMIKSNGFGHCYSSNGKEAHLSQSSGKEVCLDTRRLNFPMERGAVKQEEQLNQPVSEVLDQMPKPGIIFELPNITIPDGFNLAIDGNKGYTATEESSEILDHYNPAVDSPCWKGVPTSRFTPSGGSEAVGLQNLKKKSEACKNLNLQQTQIFPPCSGDMMKTSYNLCENSAYSGNGYVELGSLLSPDRVSNANCSAREQGLADALEAGFNFHRSQFGNELKLYDDIKKHGEEEGIPNNSGRNLELNSSSTKQPSLLKGHVISGRESKLGSGDLESGLNVNNTLEDCTMESIPCLPLEEDDCKLCQPYPAESTPKMNVQMLVNAMQNLSELLLFHCSNDTSSLSGQNCEALKHVINNLDACLPKRTVHANSARESTFSRGGASSESRKLLDLNKDVTAGKCNADVTKANKMVQAIKEVLKDDFSGEEETHTEALFKNLWLEAEAALCSTNYRARFNRVKIEMDKSKLLDMKETTKTLEKTLSSKFSPDSSISLKATAEAKDGSVSENFIQGSPVSSATKIFEKLPSPNDSSDQYRNIEVSSEDSLSSDNLIQELPVSNRNKIIDDVEASVMARFHILKYRGQNSNFVGTEGQQSEEEVKRNYSPCMQEQDGPHSQNSNGPHSDDETKKELLVGATDDDLVIRHGIQLPSGWSDSSSSDWEHV